VDQKVSDIFQNIIVSGCIIVVREKGNGENTMHEGEDDQPKRMHLDKSAINDKILVSL